MFGKEWRNKIIKYSDLGRFFTKRKYIIFGENRIDYKENLRGII